MAIAIFDIIIYFFPDAETRKYGGATRIRDPVSPYPQLWVLNLDNNLD